MPHRSATELLVLHALGLKGFADATAVALMTGLDPPLVESQLDAARRAGLVDQREDRVSGWALTPPGRARHRALLAVDAETSGAVDVVVELYGRFLGINARFRRVSAEWHLRATRGRYLPNRHQDAEYDRSVVGAVHDIDERVQPICATLAGIAERMSPYGRRLSVALARVDAGDQDAVARPLAGSYDEVWTELHQDLEQTTTAAATPVAP
jgi:DNA-binding transcriptional ArsR family regulator